MRSRWAAPVRNTRIARTCAWRRRDGARTALRLARRAGACRGADGTFRPVSCPRFTGRLRIVSVGDREIRPMKSAAWPMLAAGCIRLGCRARAADGADAAARLGFAPDVAAAMRGIDAERIRAHVKFLADDLLEGRGTGARGGDIAAHYIAAQFALYGLQPAGDDGSYLAARGFHRCADARRHIGVPGAAARRAARTEARSRITSSATRLKPSASTSMRRSCSSATGSRRRNTAGTISRGWTSRARWCWSS